MSFQRIRVDSGQNWRKKSFVFKQKRLRVHEAQDQIIVSREIFFYGV